MYKRHRKTIAENNVCGDPTCRGKLIYMGEWAELEPHWSQASNQVCAGLVSQPMHHFPSDQSMQGQAGLAFLLHVHSAAQQPGRVVYHRCNSCVYAWTVVVLRSS